MNVDIIKKTYIKLMIVQFFGIVISAANSTIDTMITGLFLGADVIAATGLFAPVVTLIGLSYVFIIGFQILCSRSIGSGDSRKVVSLFSTSTVFLTVCGVIISVSCLVFREQLALLLSGGKSTSNVTAILEDYIHGYSYGITFQILSGMMMVFLPLNNNTNLSYLSIVVMLVSNISLDLLSVKFELGAFGLGMATSISFLLSCLSMLPSFINKYKAVHIEFGDLCFSSLGEAAMLGLPSLMFTLGCTLKSYVMNMALMRNLGTPAVAVMNVQGNICSIMGAIPMGCANAFLSLGSIYYGEEDRNSLLALMKYALKTGIILSSTAMVLIISSSYYISDVFFSHDTEAFSISMNMLTLFPSFLVFNIIFSLFIKVYQFQGQTRLINILSLSENVIMAVLAAIFTPMLGSNAVWLSFPASELICIVIIMLSVFMYAGKITFLMPDWMKLPDAFGANEGQFMEFTITSMEQVMNISERVIAFCTGRGISLRRSNIAGLAVEEMAGNVVAHGFRQHKNNYVDLRVVHKDVLTIRIRDNCPEFDPKKRLEQFANDDPAKNIGIKMIARLSDEMIYPNTAGINTVMIKLRDNA